jgi:transposase
VAWMNEPQEIPDEDHEQILARVCAIDVAKQSGKVCTRLPSGRGQRRVCRVWDVAATTNAITRLADQLAELEIEKVTLESTSDYLRHEGA